MDQNKKTMRHFYCRDVLWDTFEQMANDFDCSIDYLINEAMRHYARSKSYSPQAGPGGGAQQPSRGGNPSLAVGRRPPPPPGGPPAGPPSPAAPPQGPGYSVGRRTMQQPSAYRPSGEQRRSQEAPSAGAGPTLFLLFNSQRIPIDKDQFIIGRGSKTSDLAIKDGNISRKHAAIIRRNGTFYIKDLGSTNGIDYKGMRIDNKRIDEGDIFHLCDYELRFTYRG
ncbi:MAG: FHA domain-containing protein [Deltaproteobacteria bacterium]|nr:FHA domain-containing protein [Deltaproteobacteria bacterium]